MDLKVQAIARYMKEKKYDKVVILPPDGIPAATGMNSIAAVIEEKLAAHQIKNVGR